MENLRIKIVCKIISLAIKLMAKDWQTQNAIKNLITTGLIETK